MQNIVTNISVRALVNKLRTRIYKKKNFIPLCCKIRKTPFYHV